MTPAVAGTDAGSDARCAGSASVGIGGARNRRRHARPSRFAQRVERATRALSVAIPVFAYIWR
jgi:hypothetical protein